MKSNYRKLQLLISLRIINPDDFYCITVYRETLSFQGVYTRELTAKFSSWLVAVEKNGHIVFRKKNIEIRLT